MFLHYTGSKTQESIVLEFAHVKYEFSEKNGYICEIPNELFAHIITPDKIGVFIPCDAPVTEKKETEIKEEEKEKPASKLRGRPKGRSR